VTCACSKTPSWQKPLLTDRKGFRRDAQLARPQSAFVNGIAVRPGDASIEAHRQSQQRGGGPYARWQRIQPAPARGDAAEIRTDSDVEVLIDGRRCVLTAEGWVTSEGKPCPRALSQES